MSVLPPGVFGAGGAEPWSETVREQRYRLALVHADGTPDEVLDAARWFRPADRADRSTLRRLDGPVLDIGSGPGRMIAAALAAGLDAWGLEVEPAMVHRCRQMRLPVLHQDLFAAVPREGAWGALLLLDGNIGIGGDVEAILARCRTLLAPGGLLVVETDHDRHRDETVDCRLRNDAGEFSASFPWAHAGTERVLQAAAGFRFERRWTKSNRRFLRLRRA